MGMDRSTSCHLDAGQGEGRELCCSEGGPRGSRRGVRRRVVRVDGAGGAGPGQFALRACSGKGEGGGEAGGKDGNGGDDQRLLKS